MSAGICGKRVGFEELFGSSSPSSKRSRRSSFGSSEFVSGYDDLVSALMHMFPSIDPEMVKTVLSNNNNKLEDAKESLRTLSLDDVAAERIRTNNFDIRGESTATCSQMPDNENEKPNYDHENMIDGSKWVDLFVCEMMNATNVDDARQRAARILEALEKSISDHSRSEKEREHVSLKEHLQSLINDNQILKRVVAIQHERNLEHEERNKEVQHLKVVVRQYQEQVQKLELNNYAMRLHLQRAQGSSSFPGHFS